MTTVDVLQATWLAAGEPSLGTTTSSTCARCRRDGAGVPVRDVVSKVFTAFDGWADTSGRALCSACAWAYQSPRLRLACHLVRRDPLAWIELTPEQAGDVLSEPVAAAEALVVPLHPGRKHLLHTATWGRVTVEDAQLPWTVGDVDRLAVLRSLRDAGFGPRMLTEPAPPWAVLRRLPVGDRSTVIDAWRRLDSWRARPLWLQLALTVTARATAGSAGMTNLKDRGTVITTCPTDRWLSAVDAMPALDGPAGVAERLLLLVHYGIDWQSGWVGRRRSAYWDQVLPDRVIAATYRSVSLRRWWADVAGELESQPRTADERAELERLLRADPLPVLEVLRSETEALLLRVRIVADSVRQERAEAVA